MNIEFDLDEEKMSDLTNNGDLYGLLNYLKHENRIKQRKARRAIVLMADKKTPKQLKKLVKQDGLIDLQEIIDDLLMEIKEKLELEKFITSNNVKKIGKYLNSQYSSICEIAIKSLGEIGGEKAMELLESLINSDEITEEMILSRKILRDLKFKEQLLNLTEKERNAFKEFYDEMNQRTITINIFSEKENGWNAYQENEMPVVFFSAKKVVHALKINNKFLQDLPSSILKLNSLEKLELEYDGLKRITIHGMNSLKTLDLKGNRLEDITILDGSLQALEILDLSENQIRILPNSLEKLRELRILRLNNNKISRLPETFAMLPKLEGIDLRNNLLSSLSSWIGKLTSLKVLLLSNNQLDELPNEILELSNLEGLDLSNNQITMLPNGIIQLKKLKKLRLNNTGLKLLPTEIHEMKALQELHVSGNKIETLPKSLTNLPKLTRLELVGNPLVMDKVQQKILKKLRKKKIDVMIE
ncbi:MAG: leucine-rich repeat domain-containing protein [Candidatus Helarchaeota archaeon]